jgi:uncharacterized DUF497 family protein
MSRSALPTSTSTAWIFADLRMDFFAAATTFPARARRHLAIGWLDRDVVAVIFARLGSEGISVISMRAVSLKERRLL